MVQAAQSAALHPGPLGAFFRKIAKKKNRNVAIVAVARKLVTIAWHMLTNNEPYRYAVPSTLDAKFARLRILATGEKGKRGLVKGTPRSANYGTGVRTRAVPALADIYAREGLPAIVPLDDNPAELRALQQHEPSVLRHAQQVSVAKRVPRRRSSESAVPAKEGAANKQ